MQLNSKFKTQARRFAKIHIEISNICNLQCSFCPVVERNKGFMAVEDFRFVLEQTAPLAEQICLHLMGEPLLHPHFAQLLEICHHYEARLFLVTNGVLLKEKTIDLLQHPVFRQVNFSLHSFKDNFPAKDPKPYLDKIFRFTEQAFANRPDLYINYRLWNLSDPKGQTEANLDMLSMIGQRFEVAMPQDLDVRHKKGFRLKNRLYLHLDTEFIWPSMDLPELSASGTCYGLSSHFAVLIDGTVVPCCLDKEGVIALGNIKEEAIETILAGPKATAILRGFKTGKLVEPLCQRCQYIERFR